MINPKIIICINVFFSISINVIFSIYKNTKIVFYISLKLQIYEKYIVSSTSAWAYIITRFDTRHHLWYSPMGMRWTTGSSSFITIFTNFFRRTARRPHSDGRAAGIWTNWRHLGIFFFPSVRGFHKALFFECIFKLYLKVGKNPLFIGVLRNYRGWTW